MPSREDEGKDGRVKGLRERQPVRVYKTGSHESKRKERGGGGRLEGGVGEELRGLTVQKGSQEPALKPTA